MDFRSAERIARIVEKEEPDIIVVGPKQLQRFGKRPTWAVHVVNLDNGRMATIDEPRVCTKRLAALRIEPSEGSELIRTDCDDF